MEKLIEKPAEKLVEKLRRLCGNIFKTLIDILFPQDPLTSALEVIEKSDVKTRRDFFELLPAAPPAPPEYPWIHSCFAYKNAAVERIVWAVKYERNTILASLVAEAIMVKLLQIVDDLQSKNQKTILIPLPSSKKRIRERGYDHIKLVTDALWPLIRMHPMKDGYTFSIQLILKKERHTRPQSKLTSREERLGNLMGAFCVLQNTEIDPNVNYILIDDVCTTGTTLRVAREYLFEAGAMKVEAITFAR